MDNLLTILINLLPAIVTPLLAFLFAQVSRLIGTKVKNEYAQGVAQRLATAIRDAVDATEQVFSAKARELSADGVLSAEDRKEALRVALEYVKGYYGQKGLNEFAKIIGAKPGTQQFEAALTARVEAQIAQNKADALWLRKA